MSRRSVVFLLQMWLMMCDVEAWTDFNVCIVSIVMRTRITFSIDRSFAPLPGWPLRLRVFWILSVLSRGCLCLWCFDTASWSMLAQWSSIHCGVPHVVCPNVSQQTDIVSIYFHVPFVCSLGWSPVEAIFLNILCVILSNVLMWTWISWLKSHQVDSSFFT